MEFDFDRRSRRSVRLKGFDYSSPGKYFMTICTLNRECLFGEIRAGEMILSAAGEIVNREWRRTTMVRFRIDLDAFVIMPNHLHGIVSIRMRRGVPAAQIIRFSGYDLSTPTKGTDRHGFGSEQIQFLCIRRLIIFDDRQINPPRSADELCCRSPLPIIPCRRDRCRRGARSRPLHPGRGNGRRGSGRLPRWLGSSPR